MDRTTLNGDRVVLRPPGPDDAGSITSAIQDEDIPRWIDTIPWPYTRTNADLFISETVASGWESGQNPIWGIFERSHGRLVGTTGLTARLPGVYEIGFWLSREARGRGLMTESAALVCEFAFKTLAAGRVEWQAAVGNLASRRVADRLGFSFEGVTSGRLRQGGTHVDGWLASLGPQDPRVRGRRRVLPWAPIAVSGEVVSLRAGEQGDAAWVQSAYADADVRQWNPADVVDADDARQWIATRNDWSSGTHASWVFVNTESGKPMGSVSLHKVNEENLTSSVGYWTHPKERGNGAATAAVALVSRWALADLGLKRVELIHAVANPASCAVATSAGFDLEGTVRNGERYGDGRWYDEHIHGLVATDERQP